MATAINKGFKTEEILRIYFLKNGYYVARGIPFNYRGFAITDIDLWLYNRTSSVSREISIVDIKNKKTPQAIERIFWVKGLQTAIKATNALIATTDKRPDVKDFGKDLNVFVLDGNFLNKIKNYEQYLEARLTDEEIISMIDSYSLSKLDGDWKNKFLEAKSLLALGLNFDNMNKLLNITKFFVEQIFTKPSQKEISLRIFYLLCSYIAINLDYIQRDLAFLEDADARKNAFKNGFRYGNKGEKEIKRIIDMSLSFVEQYADNGQSIANQARYNISKQFENMPTDILAEYFSDNKVLKSIFASSLEFELLSANRIFKLHTYSTTEVKSFIAVLLDFYGIDRVFFAKTIE
ncbi:hypothetical protein [Sulfurimonas sp.]|uniref:hypothetical protein n=1 Tax=Sulfurimonas sp. TaxID=2022749 RepID=UPI00260540F2|nr:hypothetical protein [Sulfurimonas sp.]MDD5158097.1 hypothetical protein [Sulfurimonas sp.]